MKKCLSILAIGLAGSVCFAQMGQVIVSGTAKTNSTATTTATTEGNGLIYRAVVSVTGGTSDVVIASSDGTALISTNTVDGSVTITPSTPPATVGVVLKTSNANTNAGVTAKVTLTIQK